MLRRTPRSTRSATLFPYTTLLRSLASHNAGKLKELQAMPGGSVQLRSIGEFSQVEPEETGLSFVENAILKARNAARISGLPALADDSRSEEHTSELQSLMRISYDVFCLKKKTRINNIHKHIL